MAQVDDAILVVHPDLWGRIGWDTTAAARGTWMQDEMRPSSVLARPSGSFRSGGGRHVQRSTPGWLDVHNKARLPTWHSCVSGSGGGGLPAAQHSRNRRRQGSHLADQESCR